MMLAEEQMTESLRADAANNFHTGKFIQNLLHISIFLLTFRIYFVVAIYYRVLESMLPSMAAEIHSRLMYAGKSNTTFATDTSGNRRITRVITCLLSIMSAWRTKQASNLLENYVVEHFEGNTCSDVYEVHASNKLGKGSYGSVYLATHRFCFPLPFAYFTT